MKRLSICIFAVFHGFSIVGQCSDSTPPSDQVARTYDTPKAADTILLKFAPTDVAGLIAPATGFEIIDAYAISGVLVVDGEEVQPYFPENQSVFLDSSRGIIIGQDKDWLSIVLLFSLEGVSKIIVREMPDASLDLSVLGFSDGILFLRVDDYIQLRTLLIRVTGDW
ncbi:MAG: hypothetical protein ABIH23_00150, partial [bacterium]